MPSAHRRNRNESVTRFWNFAAPAYDLPVLQRWVYRPPQDEVLTLLRAHNARRIADIACGTGILTARIQRELRTEVVYGVDMSVGMLKHARVRSSAVHWLNAPAEQLPFDDNALDAVVTTTAFHFFDQPAALREFHRVLAPGGTAAVATVSPRRRITLPQFMNSDRAPAYNPSPTELRGMFTDAGFTDIEQHRVQRPIWTQLISDRLTVGSK